MELKKYRIPIIGGATVAIATFLEGWLPLNPEPMLFFAELVGIGAVIAFAIDKIWK